MSHKPDSTVRSRRLRDDRPFASRSAAARENRPSERGARPYAGRETVSRRRDSTFPTPRGQLDWRCGDERRRRDSHSASGGCRTSPRTTTRASIARSALGQFLDGRRRRRRDAQHGRQQPARRKRDDATTQDGNKQGVANPLPRSKRWCVSWAFSSSALKNALRRGQALLDAGEPIMASDWAMLEAIAAANFGSETCALMRAIGGGFAGIALCSVSGRTVRRPTWFRSRLLAAGRRPNSRCRPLMSARSRSARRLLESPLAS